ncbi:DUF6221 family protein [Embleya sp. NPDC020630]|uniref:DUF6221 family protein n=1 Tax=Embleya sp. NPDC020630 TaxID=3363979 RepID=UPI0037A99CDC
MTDDLVAFLRARLDEAAHDANAAASEIGPDWYYDAESGSVASRREHDMVATGAQDQLGPERGAHIARHDPARVLRDVAARRRIVENYTKVCGYGRGGYTPRDEAYVLAEGALATTIKILATVYADHPDYQEAWKP